MVGTDLASCIADLLVPQDDKAEQKHVVLKIPWTYKLYMASRSLNPEPLKPELLHPEPMVLALKP